MKKQILLFALCSIFCIYAQTYEIPLCPSSDDAHNSHQIVIYEAFSLCYREIYEQAEWVAYELTSNEVTTPEKTERKKSFKIDKNIISASASSSDYTNSGYDRGHLAPAADMAFSPQAMSDSFLMSNVSPQQPTFNRGVWLKLENLMRTWALLYGRIFIVSGPILEKTDYPTIGKNGVAVPEFFYKVILVLPAVRTESNAEVHAIGFILPNHDFAKPLSGFAVSIDEVEERTGIDFFYKLSDELENNIESRCDLTQWDWANTEE